MNLLPREEQQKIVLEYERRYGRLVMQGNKTGSFRRNALALSSEIRSIAVDKYFEDDFVEFLQSMSASIANQARSSNA